ncbi:MAG: autotransporter adhesin family protein, partial [Verrucomicrobia bacterium]|nr:autotransporter adhesin family protein [Verrucomicrobiota bacterium]
VPNGFTLRVDGGVTAFGYDFASIGASVTINNGDVSISAYVSVNLGLFSVGGTVTIDLGQISPPPAPPPPPQLGSMSGGTLTLNIGPNASNRTFNGATIGAKANEAYTITVHSVNGDGSEDLWVEAPGIYTGPAEIAETQTTISGAPAGTVEYDNVTSIVAVTGTSNTTLNFSGVNVPITITSGTGTNHYIFGGGSGAVTITGGGGNDSIIGGSGNVTFTANGGSGVFIGGTAQNAIINDPGTFIVIEQGYDHYDLNGTTLKYWNGTGTVYTDSITGPATVNLETPSTPAVGGDTLSFSVESLPSDFTLTLNGNGGGTVPVSVSGTGDIELNGTTVSVNGNNITLQGATEVTLIGTGAGDHLTANNSNFYSMVNMTGQAAGDSFTVNYQGSGSYAVNVNGSGSGNTLTINGTGADNIYTINGSPVSLGSETVAYSGVQNLVLNTYNGNDTVKIEKTAAATTVNGGSGNDTFNVQNATNPVTLNLGSGTNEVYAGSGANLDTIHALLTVTGGLGGTDTINLDDSANNSALTATLTTTSLTGVFGAGGSMNYSNIGTINLMLGNGLDVVNVQGMNGTVNIALGTGPNTLNIGSNAGPIVTDPTSGMAANTGSILDRLVGVLNFTGTGNNVINVDDSGGNKPLVGALTPTSIEFANLVVINLPNVVSITIALGQAGDTFVITDTAPTAPAVVDGDGGNDTFIVLDTHSTVTINGGDGDDNFYNFGNSGVLNLNGNDGNDSFFIYASVNENTTNLDPGGSNNKIYSYRLNNSVNINGGAGNNKLYIF